MKGVSLALFVGVGMVTRTALFDSGETEELVMQRMDQMSIAGLASIIGMTVNGLVDKLGNGGFSIEVPK